MPRKVYYSRWLTIGGLLALIFMLASCQSNCGGTSPKISQPTAPEIISKAQDAIQKVKSYHFNLTTDHPGTVKGGSVQIKKAEGDIQVPDKLRATADVITSFFTGSTNIVVIDNQQYFTFPLTGQWVRTNDLGVDPRALSNSKTGIAGVLGRLQNLSTPKDSKANDAACWDIKGKLDAQYLSAITGQASQPGNIVDTTTCIGKADNLPYFIRMQGIAIQGDTVQTVRTFKLSQFNKLLTISRPRV